jgi:hypothetical protein
MAQFEDGTGKGYKAKVNENNRLHTHAVTDSAAYHATTEGDSYNINTGEITLTSEDETAILYLKNNESSQDLHITAFAFGLGPSTSGSSATGINKITIIRNPTTGNIVTGASGVDINSNRNYGSSKTLTVDAYKGTVGSSFTNGTDHIVFYQTSNGRLFAGIDEVLERGSSIGVKIRPVPGNTTMTVYGALICNLDDPATEDPTG